MCGWQNFYSTENVTDDVDWLQGKGSDALGNDAPDVDHEGNSEGKFLYIDGSSGAYGTAILESQLLVPEQHNDFCFSFWYYMEGDVEGLSISSIVARGNETVLWEESTPTGGIWIEGQARVEAKIFIFEDVAYQLYIRGTRNSLSSKIALDDFKFEHEAYCPRKPAVPDIWSCNFKDDVCGMKNVEGFTGTWDRNNTLGQIPGVPDTWYITMHGEGYAAIETPMIESSSSPCCFTFYYYLNGAKGGALSVIPRYDVDDLGEALWTQGRPQGDQWIQAHVDITMLSPVSVVFEGLKGVNQDSVIAVDEIAVFGLSCNVLQPTVIPGQELMCDFEDSLCDFTIEDDRGTWEWIYPRQPNLTFPHADRDHTYNTGFVSSLFLIEGHYLAAPLWNGRDGIVGRVVTPEFQLERTDPQCITFWYLHNGQSLRDTLEVYVRHGLDMFPPAAWKENANHGFTWMLANIPIPTGNSHFNVLWQATQRQRDQDGVMALDDVELVLSACPKIGTCNFEYGTCGWQNLYNTENVTDDIDWIQGKGSDAMHNEAPAADHTGDSDGKFLYVDATTNVYGIATIESQLLVPEQHNEYCFKLWYYLEGSSVGVRITSLVASGRQTTLWEENTTTDGQWMLGQVKVEAKIFIFEDIAYQLLVSGLRNSNDSIIALDDFVFKYEGNCPRLPPTSSTTPQPVGNLWYCNFDENACDLEITGDAKWLKTDGVEPSEDGRAALPLLEPPSGKKCLTFWYFLKGGNMGELSLIIVKDGSEEALWTRGRPLGSWYLAAIDVPVDGDTEIVFVGFRGQNSEAIIALDEIMLASADCSVVHPTVSPGDALCDFEHPDICGYTITGVIGNWEWVFPRADNYSVPHVPVDHTYNTGYGHYMEAPLLPDQEGIVGFLSTPDIPVLEDATQCAIFWYVHNGNSNKDVLSVFISSSPDMGYPLWKEKASYIDHWLDASVPVPRDVGQMYRIYWQATQNLREEHGSMCIDDVMVILEPCGNIGTCDFSKSMCGWQNIITGDNRTDATDFILGSGDTVIDMAGPPTDHTGDPTGMYIYTDTSFGDTGEALLESQMFVPEQHNKLCFHFWYYIKGDNTDHIRIEIQPQDFSIHEIWRHSGQDDQWHEGQVHVHAEEFVIIPIPYQLFIAGMKGSPYAVIALDDFNFTQANASNCPTVPGRPPPTTPTPGGQNVSCDFTNGQCGWTNKETNSIDWRYDG
ncbi:hypothetical protein SK128_025174 [Halocaridina rubra]|uniref:MAM and LDL-receptor class A domain-containing protein 1 n=1 Tax=Halocaridina rubra TaxID=373956 RepID=A0AAN8WN36_HALRR